MLNALAELLAETIGQNVFIRFSPDVFDFTNKDLQPELHFHLQNGKEFSIFLTDENIHQVLSMLRLSVFAKGSKILVWDWKNLASYILAKTGKNYIIDGSIIDLKIIESYVGRNFKCPRNLIEALNRLKDLITSGIWKEIESIYKKLHIPLITTVIPHLESVGIMDFQKNGLVYAHYEINGQDNGRLRCDKSFSNGFVPHAMTPEMRNFLKPRSHDELFMYFDFKAQEVFTLAWLSQDKLLLELCEQKDVYQAIFDKLLDDKISVSDPRNLVKKFFLPVIYGQSAYALSQRCGLSQAVAEMIIHRINTLFPSVSTFIEGYLKQVQDCGYAKDIFGKRRFFEAGKEYLVRNFAVQAPSAIVCLEKLINLYFALRDKSDLAYTVHDGYIVYATKENWKSVFNTGCEILSSESEFCPGLKLEVTVKAGRNLNELRSISRRRLIETNN